MKEFRQRIPDGMDVRRDGRDLVYTLIEENCSFKIGDIIIYRESISSDDYMIMIFEGASPEIERSYYTWASLKTFTKARTPGSHFSLYQKATPEQEKLFKLKCLENNIWFDQVSKKWIDLKQNGIYTINNSSIEIFDKFTDYNNALCFKCSLSERISLKLPGNITIYTNIENISEATLEEQLILFTKLKEGGKEFDSKLGVIKDIKWVPEIDEYYWTMTDGFEPAETKCHEGFFCQRRIKANNFFKTEEECKKYCDHMRNVSLNYK